MVTEMQVVRNLCKELNSFRQPPKQSVAPESSSASGEESNEASDPDVWKSPTSRAVPGYMRSKSARSANRNKHGKSELIFFISDKSPLSLR